MQSLVVMGTTGSFPTTEEAEEGWACSGTAGNPECSAPQPIASPAEEVQKLPRCGCGGLRVW